MNNISRSLLFVVLFSAPEVSAQQKTLSLQDALSIANENNKTLKAKMLGAEAAREETKALRANILPTVNANGSYSYYFDRQVIFMPGALTGNENEPVVDVAVGGRNAFNTNVSLSQPIFSEYARRQIKGGRINESIHDLQVKDERGNLLVDVTLVYYQTLLIQESIALNRQSIRRNIHALEDSRSLFHQGKSLKVDTLRNYIIVENLKTTIAYLESQHDVHRMHLRQLLGISEDVSLLLTDSLTHDDDQRYFAAVPGAYTESIENRPDLQIKKLNVDLTTNYMGQSRAQRFPTLSFAANYQIQAQADDRPLSSYEWLKTSFVGVQANFALFSGGRINARIRQSVIALQKSQLELTHATDKARTEIMGLESNLKAGLQRLTVQQKTVEAAEMNYTIVNDRYRNGLSSRLELSDAELALTEAKMNRLHSVFQVKVAHIQLRKAMGLVQF